MLKYLSDESKSVSLLKSPSEPALLTPGESASAAEAVFEVRADPEAYKKIEEFIRSLTKGFS